MKKNKKKHLKTKVVLPTVMALSMAFGGGILPSGSTFAEESQVLFQAEGLSKHDVVQAYLQSQLTGVQTKSLGTGSQFKIVSEYTDSATNTYHVRTIEQYKGIPIYGTGQTVALNANNDVFASFGKVTQNLGRSLIPTEASISEEEAIEIVKQGVEEEIGEVKGYDGIDSELMIYQNRLAYVITASTSIPAPGYFHFFLDATTGDVIEEFNALHEAELPDVEPVPVKGLNVFGKMQNFIAVKDAATNKTYMHTPHISGGTTTNPNIVGVSTYDARRLGETPFILMSALFGFTGFEVETANSFFADPAAVSAHSNSMKINDYFQKIHKRNSLDDKGMRLISTVHIGSKWNNAAWNGKQMLYGDGDGILLGSLAGGLDVAGHEMTHGVIENTTDLIYQDESGAINESLADIFGAYGEMYATGTVDWDMGEDIYTPNIPGDGGLRSLSDPTSVRLSTTYLPSGHYPDHYDDRYLGTLDRGGVHINSSINNKAAYLITDGGTHYGVTVQGIGRTKAEKIFYRALTLYLTPSSGFKDMREAAIQASRDLYKDRNGQPSPETAAVIAAYDAVGVPAE